MNEDILSMNEGLQIDALVVEKVFDWPVIWIDYWNLGEKTPYIYDPTAAKPSEHVTSTSMISANWQRYKNENGEVKEFYGRSVPRYSNSIDEMINVERKIKDLGKADIYLKSLNQIVNCKVQGAEVNIFYMPHIFNIVNASALDRCKAVLITLSE